MKYFYCDDLSCVYRLNGGSLEYTSVMQDGTFQPDDFASVEPDLVGEEMVTFQGRNANLYAVFEYAREVLTA